MDTFFEELGKAVAAAAMAAVVVVAVDLTTKAVEKAGEAIDEVIFR